MPAVVIALLPAAVVFAAAEAVCRLLLHLSDGAVPFVVLPPTLLVYGLTARRLRRRSSHSP